MALDEALRGETFDIIVIDIEGSEYFALQRRSELEVRAAAACEVDLWQTARDGLNAET